jgi:hypothetical protein
MTAPLIAWLVWQLMIVGIVVLRIPLAAHYPEPAERLALHLLLSAQIAGVAMTFPFLLRGARAVFEMLATALPFQLAAMFLTGRQIGEVAQEIAFADAWIAALAVWSAVFRTDVTRAIGVVVATCLTVGGGILRYLRLEFAPESSGVPFEKVLPLPSIAAALENEATQKGWIFLAIFASAGVLTLAVQRHHSPRRDLATSYPPPSPPPTAG